MTNTARFLIPCAACAAVIAARVAAGPDFACTVGALSLAGIALLMYLDRED